MNNSTEPGFFIKYINVIYVVMIVIILVAAQTIPCLQESYDGITMGCDLYLDVTRSEGRPLSEVIVDF
jgi:hypothetical protein